VVASVVLRPPSSAPGPSGAPRNTTAGQGGRCLAVNWRHGRAQLDLVILEGEVLVFVEVKTRHAEKRAGKGIGP
jgi:Holliday junction resolvase-like predicted endonuclease